VWVGLSVYTCSEGRASPAVKTVVSRGDVFESWLAAISKRFRTGGIEEARARALSLEILSLLEGAFILCRASRCTDALDAAGAAAASAVGEALGATTRRAAVRDQA
jgi:hypothetical protein